MALNEYLALDLVEAARKLDARIDNEVLRRDEIGLSEIIGPQPSYLTPQMDAWYQGVIAAYRQPALAELAQRFREKLPNGEEQGFFLERELAKLDNEFIVAKRACYNRIAEIYHDQLRDLHDLAKSIPERRGEYRSRKMALGRDAKVLNRPLYTIGLLAILLTESFINFASFSSLSWATPFIATGSTLIVAALVTLAAHLHGSIIKQYDFHFGPAARDVVRSAGWRHTAIGFAALFVALAFVYYARSAYLAVYLASLGAFGLSSQGHSPLWIIGGSLLGNVAVYLAGIGWSYLLHDSDPNFAQVKEELSRDELKQKKLFKVVNGERSRKLHQLEEEWKRNVSETNRGHKYFIDQPFFAEPRKDLAAFQAKDASVIELLENYRTNLLGKARSAGASLKFSAACDDPFKREEWSDAIYETKTLRLKYLET